MESRSFSVVGDIFHICESNIPEKTSSQNYKGYRVIEEEYFRALTNFKPNFLGAEEVRRKICLFHLRLS